MSTVGLVAVAARARGLATHLLPASVLHAALDAADLDTLAKVLRAAGLPVPGRAGSHDELELAARRWAAAELARLARWLPERPALGDVLFGEEDRRSVRAMVRGAAAGVAAEARLAGLIPTPRLPERLLRELARQARVPSIAALLTSWGHPFGPPLLAAVPVGEPDLFAAERALATAALDAEREAVRTAPQTLQDWVATSIDLENARMLLQVTGPHPDADVLAMLHPGGHVPPARLLDRTRRLAPEELPAVLASCLADPVIADAVQRRGEDPVVLDDALLAARVASLRARARLDPMDPLGVVLYALRLRVQVMLLRQAIWRLALGATPAGAALLLDAA